MSVRPYVLLKKIKLWGYVGAIVCPTWQCILHYVASLKKTVDTSFSPILTFSRSHRLPPPPPPVPQTTARARVVRYGGGVHLSLLPRRRAPLLRRQASVRPPLPRQQSSRRTDEPVAARTCCTGHSPVLPHINVNQERVVCLLQKSYLSYWICWLNIVICKRRWSKYAYTEII